MTFFKGFTLDTLLGCISCILGIVSLYIGAKAYRKSKIIESSLNDNKEFYDSSSDYSQRAAGNIVNNNYDVEALANLTASNFDTSLKQAYSLFEEQAKVNLQQIIEQTKKIIREQKPNIAGLTKIDWINIYFESAKTTSDEYMQNIWAKLLAKELECPGSFSYKTLDVLKNMSSEDFRCFEKLCSLEIDGSIFQEDIHSKYELSYLELVRLGEYGLVNTGSSTRIVTISPGQSSGIEYKKYYIVLKNPLDEILTIKYAAYILSSTAMELCAIANYAVNERYVIDCAEYLSKIDDRVKISLHRINDKKGNEIYIQKDDLLNVDS